MQDTENIIGYLFLALSWLVFFAAHSGLAATSVKHWLTGRWPFLKAWYRLLYNILSLLLLLPVIYFYFKLPGRLLLSVTWYGQAAGALVALFGVYVLRDAFRFYHSGEFLGTYQLRHKHEFHPVKLNRQGWNRLVRHPLYFATLLIVAGLLLYAPTIKMAVNALMVTLYLYIGARWEEHKLISEFGPEYEIYRQEVSMLLPVKWLAAKLRRRA